MQIKITTLLAITILVLAAIITLATCNGRLTQRLKDCGGKDTVWATKQDTTFIMIPQQAALAENVKLVKVIVPRIDSFISYEFPDTTELSRYKTAYYELLTDYNTENQYVDTALFKNGIAIISNTVKQNKLHDQKTILDSIREDIVTRTIFKPVRKPVLYLGIDAYGNPKEPLSGAGFALEYQSPRSANFEVGSYFTSQQSFNFRASVKFPLTKK